MPPSTAAWSVIRVLGVSEVGIAEGTHGDRTRVSTLRGQDESVHGLPSRTVASHFGTSERPQSPCGATAFDRVELPETE